MKIRENLSDEEAIEIEVALIAAIGREKHGGPLANLTDGGEGMAGYCATPETRAKMSASAKGKPKTPEHIAAVTAALAPYYEANRGKKRPCSKERALAISRAKKGVPLSQCNRDALTGKKRSMASRQKMSEAARRRIDARKAAIALGDSGGF